MSGPSEMGETAGVRSGDHDGLGISGMAFRAGAAIGPKASSR